MLYLLLTASAPWLASLDACSEAMRGLGTTPANEIVAACPVVRDPGRLWKPDGGEPEECLSAKTFAQSSARMAHGLPAEMVNGMVKEFDAKAQKCRNMPTEQKPAPVVHSPRLWD